MSFAGNTLDLIRTVINRRNLAPVGPSYFDAVNNNSASYSNVTMGPQNGYNDYLTDSVKLDQDLMSRYADYEDMSDFPELGSALDLYADDATVQDVITNKSMWFEAEDQTVEQVLNEMLDINIRAEESLWEVTRSMCMYGNEFDELMVMDKVGVIRMNHFPAPSMRRIEDMNGILYGFIHDPSMSFRMDTASFMGRLKEKSAGELTPMPSGGMQDLIQVFEPWEMVHFRLRGKSRSDLYGFSSLEAARWAWKRLTMIEDAMVLYKLTRSPQRYAYYVDVGDVPPQQAKGFLNRIKNEFKKTKFIDPNCLTGDTLIPLLDGSHKSIKELANEYAKTKKSFWIYSYDLVRNKVVPGKAVNAVLSGENIPVYRVRLDSGAVIRCTADHPFLMRDGEYKLAADLSKGDSLMPLYLNELRADGYTGFRDVQAKKVKLVHQMVAEEIYDKKYRDKGLEAHHKNFTKHDNRPKNLEILTKADHIKAHDNHISHLKKANAAYKLKVKNDNKFRKEISLRLQGWRDRNPDWMLQTGAVEARLKSRSKNEKIDSDRYQKILILIEDILLDDQEISSEELCEALNDRSAFLSLWRSLSEGRTEAISPVSLVYVFTRHGIKGLDGFKRGLFGEVKRRLILDGKHKKNPDKLIKPAMKDADSILWKNIFSIIEKIVKLDPLVCSDELCDRLNENNEFKSLWSQLSETRIEHLKPSNIPYIFKRHGYAGLSGYKKENTGSCGRRFYKTGKQNNHKVVEVAFDGYEDVYDLVVDEYHNFGLTSGVFVHNTGKPNFRYNPMSQDEDIFLPVRKGKRSTEIEVLSGPDGQQIDDAQYFLNKIFAALKIPKSYLGADETVGRANLSQLDSRFSRTVMRIQREVKNGYNQIARVDLAAKNIDPDKVEYECHMVIPSGVFELAQMEVQQAKLDLAQRYKDAKFSEYYVWSEILGMADEDIEKVQGQRVKEQGDAGAFDADGVGTMGEVMPTAIDQARDKMDKKAKDKTDRILTEISQNQTKFAKKINEVKALTQELNHATRNQKYYKGREM